jgi:diguanylate cyclase (GGDEF)-like protein
MPKTKGRGRLETERDSLTGLSRGASGRAALAAAVADSVARGEPASLALVDVDEFRDVNRLLGAERADEVLRAVARRVAGSVPEGALAMRLAGDLFAVVLPRTEPDDALVALQAVRAAVSRGPVVAGKGAARREAHPTVSVGIAGAPRDGDSFDTLLVTAQGALRRAKSLGRDRVASPTVERMTLKSSYYPQTQLDRLKQLAHGLGVGEATILREGLEDVLLKYKDRRPPSQ